MASVNDWATKAAARIAEEYAPYDGKRTLKPHEDRIAAIVATLAEPLMQLARDARRGHYHCDDSWYCCGKCTHPDHSDGDEDYLVSHDGEAKREEGVCNCGADAWNTRVDQVLAGRKSP